ncbi:MAG: nucleotidyltransferase domain-containing protein [Deltaproteobacteria bacterium]|nr:nucleotidyltransferase domain-containing protein [Deltaproteobacteria bacterium]
MNVQILANKIRTSRYPGADSVIAAGSFIRGDSTSTSDLDLVVLFPHVECAVRESFVFENLPVEAFIHDAETLEYFFQSVDRPDGTCTLAQMVTEGVVLPAATPLSTAAKDAAASVIAGGPAQLSDSEVTNRRYAITDLIDDLAGDPKREEMTSIGVRLHTAIADLFLRSRKCWSGEGKWLARRLVAEDAPFAQRFHSAFEELWSSNAPVAVIRVSDEVLGPLGGRLFSGDRREAPASWRTSKISSTD